MFRIITLLFAISLVFISCSSKPDFSGKFGYSPTSPSPGDEVTIFYNPDSTNLAGNKNIQCIAYLFNNDLINAIDVSLNPEKTYLTGNIRTTESTLGLLIKFKSDDLLDNNDKQGYTIFLVDKNGNKLPGSLAGYAAAINRWGAYYLDMDRNKEKALQLFEQEFETNPDQKQNFYQPYFEVISAVKGESGDQIINEELSELEQKNKKTEDDYVVLTKWYSQTGNKDKAQEYENIIKEIYPKSEYVQRQKYIEFREIEDVNDKIIFLQSFEKDYPGSEYIVNMYDLIANSYRDQKEYQQVLEFLTENQNNVSTFRFYSVANRMLTENADAEIALQISKLGETRNRQEVKTPSDKKPDYYSDSEWLQDREYMLALTLFVEADALYRLKRLDESLSKVEEAVVLSKNKEGDINDLYCKVLVEKGENQQALKKIGEFIKSGYATKNMRDYLREAYINENGSEKGFEEFVAQFEDAADKNLIDKLKLEMIFETAPDFTLLDLKGNKVSLADFKE